MLRMPIGVQELLGNPPTPQPPLPGTWKYFCMKTDAENLCHAMNQNLGLSLTVQDDSEGNQLFVYTPNDPNLVPRVWAIVGQDTQGNEIYESAGWVLDRRVKPALGVDKGTPYSPGDNLTMNFAVEYGIAQFYWSK